MRPPAIEFRKISKVYGDFFANKEISFSVALGSIHGLIGENGAGKSTLMKILFGLELPTSGEILVENKSIKINSPVEAKKLGVGMVHQHFMQAENLTALNHFELEHGHSHFWKNALLPIPRNSIRRHLTELAQRHKMPIPLDEKVFQLSIGYQQRIEILKLLDLEAKILVFDEPTAVLAPMEIESLLEQLRELKSQGKTILLISHKLNEIKSICDDVSVLRRGKLVWSGSAQQQTVQSMADLMVGEHFQKSDFASSNNSKYPVVGIKNLSGTTSSHSRVELKEINLELNSHEIVGIAGIEGNGQHELVQALCNPTQFTYDQNSKIQFRNRSIKTLSNLEMRRHGLAIICEDRLREACVPGMTAQENYLLGHQWSEEFIHRLRIDWRKVSDHASQGIREFDVRPQSLKIKFAAYSGGNQQKLVVAREILATPKFLVAAHPTRGVDLNAIEIIHKKLIQLRDHGASVLLISADLDELFRLSDRIIALSNGRAKAEFPRGQFDERKIGVLMVGATA